jgi:hypothetical protein
MLCHLDRFVHVHPWFTIAAILAVLYVWRTK